MCWPFGPVIHLGSYYRMHRLYLELDPSQHYHLYSANIECYVEENLVHAHWQKMKSNNPWKSNSLVVRASAYQARTARLRPSQLLPYTNIWQTFYRNQMLPRVVSLRLVHTQNYERNKELQEFFLNVPVRLLGTRFTNAISSFEHGPQEP
jgi:hypothetical protein